jgi:sugar O-acyltransferase (sialic acid O-acetyltransferase NeuD family)
MHRKIAVIGGGGLAKEIIEVILMNGDEVYGIFAKENSLNYAYLGYLDELNKHKNNFDGVILAIGAVNKDGIKNRKNIIDFLKKENIKLISVISPFATISNSVKIGDGVYIGHNVLISCDSKIENNVLINHNAIIGHDVKIDENVSIAPQVFLGGGVIIEKNVMIGVGATLKQGIKIGNNSIIGMRSVIIKNIKQNSIVLPTISKIYTN